MSKIRRFLSGNSNKNPGIVTGKFDLHYEDVIRNNRYVIIAILGAGILAGAFVLPIAVYRSVAQKSDGYMDDDTPLTAVHETTITPVPSPEPKGNPVQLGTDSAAIKLTPSVKKAVKGSTFTITITVTTPAAVTGAKAAVTYDPAKLSVAAVSYAASPLTDAGAGSSNVSGSLTVSRSSPMPTQGGTFVLATVTFKVNVTGSPADISLAKDKSAVLSDFKNGADILKSVEGTSISL